MRASRLLSILLTLQARGRVTAQMLADECEVSLRTIYRDIDALSASGIPVYSERGSDGGYRLLEGYRTRLNGLTEKEADALFLAGLQGPAADLGLGAVMAAAENKLLVALPPELRDSAERMRTRFHFDAPGWFNAAEQPAHLPRIADALWQQRAVRTWYRSWKAEKRREIEPLGLVLKSGAWYLVGKAGGEPRTYRVSRMHDVETLERRFERPPDFDLSAYWAESTRRLDREMHPRLATLRLSPLGLRIVKEIASAYARDALMVLEGPDADGWTVVRLPVGSDYAARSDLLRLATEAEVLDPPDLRAAMARAIATLHERYGGVSEPEGEPAADQDGLSRDDAEDQALADG